MVRFVNAFRYYCCCIVWCRHLAADSHNNKTVWKFVMAIGNYLFKSITRDLFFNSLRRISFRRVMHSCRLISCKKPEEIIVIEHKRLAAIGRGPVTKIKDPRLSRNHR